MVNFLLSSRVLARRERGGREDGSLPQMVCDTGESLSAQTRVCIWYESSRTMIVWKWCL